jgi:hypothetical protein
MYSYIVLKECSAVHVRAKLCSEEMQPSHLSLYIKYTQIHRSFSEDYYWLLLQRIPVV